MISLACLHHAKRAARARVLAYALLVSIVCALVTGRAVYADFAEATLRAGRDLDGLNDVLGGSKTLFINGMTMKIATAFTEESPTQVLDRFEGVCRAHPELLVRALSDIPATLLDKAHVHRDHLWRLGVLRKQAGDEGALTCFTDDRPASLGGLAARLKAFEASEDLAEFGRFRYVYVKRTRHGTHVRTVWADGALNLAKAFPTHGDAEGFDSPAVPRPPQARRILSVTSANVPFAVHAYRAAATEPSLRTFYEEQMKSRGWQLVTPAAQSTLGFLRDGALTLLTFRSRKGGAVVTITESARPDTPAQTEVAVAPAP